MKRIAILLLIIPFFAGCEKPYDCIKPSGALTSKVYEGLTFTKIVVSKRIGVVINQGDEYRVEVRTGENLINDIEVTQTGDLLKLSDNTECNWTRSFGETVIYITAPNITDIYSKSEQEIRSGGVLTYPHLHLTLMDGYDGFSGTGTGDIILELNNESVFVENNNFGRFYLSGHTQKLEIGFYENGGVLRAENLWADVVQLYHRGSNDMHVRPVNEIHGGIYNVGDVLCYSHPPVVDVHEYYRGDFIYK
ncbi:MAG: DUF2807 domain-containing protein [Bacteroidetes bacterium]|nr:DUF2807 domain-containing protein [Bacteroidota bacterium]